MKNIKLYCIVFIMVLPLIGHSQNNVIFKIGMNQSNIRGDFIEYDFNQPHKPYKYEWTGGLFTGIAFQIKINNTLLIEPEFAFTESGFEWLFYEYYQDSVISTHRRNIKLDYFKFSVLVKWNFDSYLHLNNKNISFFAIAGPNLSVLLNGTQKEDHDLGVINELELYDFGLTLGGGSAYHLGNTIISLEIRYCLGFVNTKIFDFFSEFYDISTDTFNKSWEFLACYKFPITK